MQEGFELVLGHSGKVRDLSYQIRGNFTYTLNRNKYVESVPSGGTHMITSAIIRITGIVIFCGCIRLTDSL